MITLALCLAATDLPRPVRPHPVRPQPVRPDDPAAPRPVALGAVQFDEDGIFSRYQGYIRQEDVSISLSANRAHGITDQIARGRGIPERTALSWLTNSFKASDQLIGWTLEFDLAVIGAALRSHGGDPDVLIRPGLKRLDLRTLCAPFTSGADGAAGDAAPGLGELIAAVAPEAGPATGDILARAEGCRAIHAALAAAGLLKEGERAA